jgi:hypothetical protein
LTGKCIEAYPKAGSWQTKHGAARLSPVLRGWLMQSGFHTEADNVNVETILFTSHSRLTRMPVDSTPRMNEIM